MKTWEYLVRRPAWKDKGFRAELQEMLNMCGQEGWELVSITADLVIVDSGINDACSDVNGEPKYYTMIFKRSVNEV